MNEPVPTFTDEEIAATRKHLGLAYATALRLHDEYHADPEKHESLWEHAFNGQPIQIQEYSGVSGFYEGLATKLMQEIAGPKVKAGIVGQDYPSAHYLYLDNSEQNQPALPTVEAFQAALDKFDFTRITDHIPYIRTFGRPPYPSEPDDRLASGVEALLLYPELRDGLLDPFLSFQNKVGTAKDRAAKAWGKKDDDIVR